MISHKLKGEIGNQFCISCKKQYVFSNFSCMLLNPNIFSNFNTNSLDMRNLKEQVKKAF